MIERNGSNTNPRAHNSAEEVSYYSPLRNIAMWGKKKFRFPRSFSFSGKKEIQNIM